MPAACCLLPAACCLRPDRIAGALQLIDCLLHCRVDHIQSFAQGLLDPVELLHGVDIDLALFALSAFFGGAQDFFAALLRLIQDSLT